MAQFTNAGDNRSIYTINENNNEKAFLQTLLREEGEHPHHEPNFFKLYLLIVPKFILQNAAGENLKTVTFITPKIILKGGRRSNILKQDIFLFPYKYYKNAPQAKIIKKTGIISEVLIPESLHPNPSRYFITMHICLSKIEGIRYAHNLRTIYIIFTHTVNGFYININTHIWSYSS